MAGNVAGLLEAAARSRPDKQVLISGDSARDWRTLERRAGGFAARLVQDGLKPGDRIALDCAAPLDQVTAFIGGLKAGAVVAPLNPRLTEDERTKIVADCGAVLVAGEIGDQEADFTGISVAPDDPAIILYTSGSTGEPKGVLLSHGATVFALASWIDPVMGLGPDDVVISVLPLAHSFGIFGSALAPLIAGGTVVLLRRFTPEDTLAAIARHRVTVFPGVATMFRRTLDCPALKNTDFSSLRAAVSGAAPCPWELAKEWKAATGVRIIRGYGMSELYRPISFAAADQTEVPDSIGRAVPGVELRIVDDDGNQLPGAEAGELWIRSPARLSEYLNQPEATAEVLEDGWFKTGDLATISDDGYVRIVGRKKEMILRGGYTIAAGEVEQVLMTHPEVADAAVIGVAHPDLGEDIAAFVTLRPGAAAGAADIVAFCKARMASYKYPRDVRIRAELPKGPTGKVIKAQIEL
jgi:long-chain acyl-CoA synthetase